MISYCLLTRTANQSPVKVSYSPSDVAKDYFAEADAVIREEAARGKDAFEGELEVIGLPPSVKYATMSPLQIVEQEREACAKLVETIMKAKGATFRKQVVAAIRARGDTK